ncbi:PREDICTED: uncharacterized protein LOC108975469 [Bactrocera latifrons]|uniref:uncharacterized protein LOC108975469 n=1 Tax=Bactrocera latifrons TaxID=174628 RepID=UPI0008DDDBB1|nr:PREDICTED: uncharacterized protein LOC108975469 [Bactrocera latifrons]
MNRNEIFELTVDGLKERLGDSGLSTIGRKATLQDRLMEHFGLTVSDGSETDVEEVANQRSLREDSMTSFKGTRRPSFEQWLEGFEANASAVRWNELQKFIYAKQLLKSAAKIFIRSQRGISSWSSLKLALRQEFDGAEFRQKKVEETPQSKEEVNTGAVRKDRSVGLAKPKKFDVKLNVGTRLHEDEEQYMEAVRKYRRKISNRRALEVPNNESEGAVVAKEPREFRISEASSKVVYETAEIGTNARNNPVDEGDNRIVQLSEEFGTLCMVAGMEKIPVGEVDLSHLDKEKATIVRRLVANYKPTGNSNSPVEMKILLSDDTPVYENPRRMSYTDRQEVDEQVKEWLKDGIIKPSNSNYSSPVVLVSKKDGKKRLCCGYRRLNTKIVRDNFAMPNIDDVIEKLQGANIFTTLDLSNGFCHVPVEATSRNYTAFVTYNGQYEFEYVPFGISNS